MQETVSLPDILKELKERKRRIEHIEEIIEELMDSTLTPEEEKLLEDVREKIKKGDFSEFVPLEELDKVLEE